MTAIPPTLAAVVVAIVLVESVLLGFASLLIVGYDRLSTLGRCPRARLRVIGPPVAVLLLVLAVNSVTRDLVPELSWIVGANITGHIHAVEGTFVARLQSLGSPAATAYFSFVYVFGYVFLLVFPFVAYGVLDDLGPFLELVVAYVVNYGAGLASYVVFVAYGPRNLMPDLVEPLLYTTYPQFQLLTSQVNTNTNVFPSLHASLSLTVAILAYRTRGIYPSWFALAAFLASSVAVSTMYLGIHWATDVVAGALLAGLSVAVARRYLSTTTKRTRLDAARIEE